MSDRVAGQKEDRAVKLLAASLGGVSLLLTLCTFALSPTVQGTWMGIALLALYALLAELWPVTLSSRGLRVTLTLPFLVGMVAYAGPVAAIAADLFVTLAAAVAMMVQHRQKIGALWIGLNLAIAGLSSGSAALVWMGISSFEMSTLAQIMVASFAFVATYMVVNLGCVRYVDRVHSKNSWRDSVSKALRIGLINTGVYFFFGVVVATLAAIHQTPWAGLMFLPLAALRSALEAEHRITENYYDTISALSLMLQRAHPYTLGHLRRVSSIAEEVARRLGLGAKRARWVREAAVLHDIGKIAIDEEVLDKPSRLSEDEFLHVRKHAEFGAQILSPVDALRPMVKWIRHHHERPDGSGYPDQLSDAEIPIESKIIAVVDAYDAMTGGDGNERRAYQEPKTSAEAIAELERCSGSQFDPTVVQAFKLVILGGRAS